MRKRVLVLGGTRFLGRAITDAALGRGDQVTLFNRGLSGADLYPGLETIIGDRTGDLSELAGRDWDVVVDVAAYDPAVVASATAALAGRVSSYVFVSSLSVYADQSTPQSENCPVIELSDDLTDEGDLYGARKAASERIVTGAFGDGALIARPGMIVGPYDPTDRFAYWPRRMVPGGRVLAPGQPDDLVQFIDVRDLAEWIVQGYHRALSGVFNLTGRPTRIGEFLGECAAATDSDAELIWVPAERLLAAGVDPWMGVPMLIAVPGWEAASQVDVRAALAAGLEIRPVRQTIRDTLSWDLARGGPAPGAEGLSAEDEERLLALG
jgi:2'-hydroxyisoflavone reductase